MANNLKDEEVTEENTQTIKRIQNEWKRDWACTKKNTPINFWKSFKGACNTYFEKVNSSKNANLAVETDNLKAKEAVLNELKAYDLSSDKSKDLAFIKSQISAWKKIGKVPFKKKNINQTFNKVLDALFLKLDIDKQESELLKYGDKLSQLADSDNDHALAKERSFIRKKNGRMQKQR